MTIDTVTGDATVPMHEVDDEVEGPCVIAHIVNNKGGWGSGFVVPLAEKYPTSKTSYIRWSILDKPDSGFVVNFPEFELGWTQFVPVKNDICIANMCAQNGYASKDNPRAVNYKALLECLTEVRDYAQKHGAYVQMPLIGSGLGGGDWETIYELIDFVFDDWNEEEPFPDVYIIEFG